MMVQTADYGLILEIWYRRKKRVMKKIGKCIINISSLESKNDQKFR